MNYIDEIMDILLTAGTDNPRWVTFFEVTDMKHIRIFRDEHQQRIDQGLPIPKDVQRLKGIMIKWARKYDPVKGLEFFYILDDEVTVLDNNGIVSRIFQWLDLIEEYYPVKTAKSQQTMKGIGRPPASNDFRECILVEDKEETLARLHSLIDVQTQPKCVREILKSFMEAGKIRKPQYRQALNEFANVGGRSTYDKFFAE